VFQIIRNRLADQRGTAVIEMALALPLLLVLVLGILDFGKAFNYWNDVNHLAAEGARYAAVNRSPDGGDLKAYIKQRADTPELRSLAEVCISFPTGVAKVGEPVRVTVTADHSWVDFLDSPPAPLNGIRTITAITGTAEHRLEVVPDYAAGCTLP
jgi:Flp pilus assembly protein TadG